MAPVNKISKLGRGQPLKSQTKEVINKLYKYFETAIERDPNSNVSAAQLVTHSTGISTNAIKKAITEFKANLLVKKEHKFVKKRCRKNLIADDFDAQAIRRVIHSFYTKDEDFPVLRDLYLILKADMDYHASMCTLRSHIAKLGFKWMQKEDHNSVLIEKHEVRITRVQYLSKIEEYRNHGRNIVYTGEIPIESNRIAPKPRSGVRSALRPGSTMLKYPAKVRVIVLMAADENDILKTTLFMYDAREKEFREENETKKGTFEAMDKWFKSQVIPNLKPNTIVVVDGGSDFHSRVSNPMPHSSAKKKDMMDYLAVRGVPYSSDMYKSQLYQLVLMNKDKSSEYKSDAMLRDHGHTVLRLPPHHPDLNPVKNILSSVKTYVGKDLCLSAESVMKIVKENVYSLIAEDWKIACRSAEAEENNLKAVDKVIDELSEQTFKNVDEESEDSDMDDDNASDQDSMDSD